MGSMLQKLMNGEMNFQKNQIAKIEKIQGPIVDSGFDYPLFHEKKYL